MLYATSPNGKQTATIFIGQERGRVYLSQKTEDHPEYPPLMLKVDKRIVHCLIIAWQK